MSDLVWAAVVASIPPTLAVILAAHRQEKKVAVVKVKVEEVHALANDRLTKALEKIETLNLTVERMTVKAREGA